MRLPVGTTRQQAAQVAEAVTSATQRMFEEHDLQRAAEGIKTNVRGESFIDVEIVMKPPDEREMTANDVIALWRDQIGDIQGVDQITFEAERGPGGYQQDISVDLSHSDIDVLEQASRAFLQSVQRFDSARDVSDNYDKGKQQFDHPVGRSRALPHPGGCPRREQSGWGGKQDGPSRSAVALSLLGSSRRSRAGKDVQQ